MLECCHWQWTKVLSSCQTSFWEMSLPSSTAMIDLTLTWYWHKEDSDQCTNLVDICNNWFNSTSVVHLHPIQRICTAVARLCEEEKVEPDHIINSRWTALANSATIIRLHILQVHLQVDLSTPSYLSFMCECVGIIVGLHYLHAAAHGDLCVPHAINWTSGTSAGLQCQSAWNSLSLMTRNLEQNISSIS